MIIFVLECIEEIALNILFTKGKTFEDTDILIDLIQS